MAKYKSKKEITVINKFKETKEKLLDQELEKVFKIYLNLRKSKTVLK